MSVKSDAIERIEKEFLAKCLKSGSNPIMDATGLVGVTVLHGFSAVLRALAVLADKGDAGEDAGLT